jgi:NADPH:quinone reductase
MQTIQAADPASARRSQAPRGTARAAGALGSERQFLRLLPLGAQCPWKARGAGLQRPSPGAERGRERREAGSGIAIRGGRRATARPGAGIGSKQPARRAERFPTLEAMGAHTPMLESPDLSLEVRRMHPKGIDAVLDLIGNSAVLDSLAAVRPDGRVCLAGFLGGGAPIESFDPLRHIYSGVHLSFFASAFTFGNQEYPLSGIPFQTIVELAEAGAYRAKPARVFRLEEIQEAHRLMESGQANGKIVVSLS